MFNLWPWCHLLDSIIWLLFVNVTIPASTIYQDALSQAQPFAICSTLSNTCVYQKLWCPHLDLTIPNYLYVQLWPLFHLPHSSTVYAICLTMVPSLRPLLALMPPPRLDHLPPVLHRTHSIPSPVWLVRISLCFLEWHFIETFTVKRVKRNTISKVMKLIGCCDNSKAVDGSWSIYLFVWHGSDRVHATQIL